MTDRTSPTTQIIATGVWTKLDAFDKVEVLHQHGSNVVFTIDGEDVTTEPPGVAWEYRAGPIGGPGLGPVDHG